MKFARLLLAGLVGACAPASSNAQDGAARTAATPSARASSPAGAPRLAFPLDCRIGETCALQNYMDRDPGPEAKDYRCGRQTYQEHGGVDIRLLDMVAQRAGVAVLAAAPGTVSRLRDGVADVSVKTVGRAAISGAECGNGVVVDHGGGWETQYCHMARGSIRVKLGDVVTAGQPIGQVGLSGNTEYPHLHLTVRRGSDTIDPFAPTEASSCELGMSGTGLWDSNPAQDLSYRRGWVLNAGFAGAPPTMEMIEDGGLAAPSTSAPALIAYVRAINLEAGDVQRLRVIGPEARALADNSLPALDRSKAQYLMYAGKRSSPEGWPRGRYEAVYTVVRAGKVVMERRFFVSM